MQSMLGAMFKNNNNNEVDGENPDSLQQMGEDEMKFRLEEFMK